jgi:hypothetical protein
MRRLGLALGTGALLFAIAACGQNDEVGFGGAPPTTPEPTTQEPSLPTEMPPQDGNPAGFPPPAGTAQVAEVKVDASGLPEGYPRTVWTEGDGTTVGVYGQDGGCTEATAEATEQGAQRVVLKITETTTSTGPCTLELRFPPLTVKLDAPLGDRTVVLERAQVGPR